MMGVVYHANYLLYFEDARTAFLEALGYPYARIEEAGLMSPVTHMECDYREPLRYGEGAVVRTRVVLSRPTKTVYAYEVFKEGQDMDADKPCCTGRSTHCLVDPPRSSPSASSAACPSCTSATRRRSSRTRRRADDRAFPHPVRLPRQHLTIRANRLINERFALIF